MPILVLSGRRAGAVSSSREGSARGVESQGAVGLALQAWLEPPRGAPSALSRLAARGSIRCCSQRPLPRFHLARRESEDSMMKGAGEWTEVLRGA
eukprot:4627686-Pyramimonas_sp.AAC.2